MRKLVIGVDLGGTKILAGIADTNGAILEKNEYLLRWAQFLTRYLI